MVAGNGRGKTGSPTRPDPHHRPAESQPTQRFSQGAPDRPGGTSSAHHHRCPLHSRRPGTPLGPHYHPRNAATTQGLEDPVTPIRIDQALRRTAMPHLQLSRMEVAVALWDTFDAPPNDQPSTSSKRTVNGWYRIEHRGSSWQPSPTTEKKTQRTACEADSNSSKPSLPWAERARHQKPSTQRCTGPKGPATVQTHHNPRRPGPCRQKP